MNFNIESIKRKMLVKYPFFGTVVANVDYKEETNIQTAATDGKVVYYNQEYLENLSVDEQTFIFAHEICHIAFNHILRSESKDSTIWNIATDAVINAFLKRDGLKMVKGGVDIPDAINYDAEQLYKKLLQEKQQQSQENQFQQQNSEQGKSQQNQSGQGVSKEQNQQEKSQDTQSQSQNNQRQSQNSKKQSGQEDTSSIKTSNNSTSEEQDKKHSDTQSGRDSSSDFESQEKKNDKSSTSKNSSSQNDKQDVGHDTHSMWEDAVNKHKQNQNKKSQNELDENDNKEKDKKQNQINQKQEETKQLGEKESFKKNRSEKKKELEELKNELLKQTMNAGKKTNETKRNINEIGHSKQIIDWRYALRETTKYDVDWSYKNATIEDGVITANLEEQPIPETEIVIDTSGSIDEKLLKNFLRECKNILKYSKLKVGCFDTKFYGFKEIRTENDIENMEFIGGGGTNFDVAIEAFTRRVDNKIIFTDGEANMPKKPLNAIWIVFSEKQINPKGGKVIRISQEQIKQLEIKYQDIKEKVKKI